MSNSENKGQCIASLDIDRWVNMELTDGIWGPDEIMNKKRTYAQFSSSSDEKSELPCKISSLRGKSQVSLVISSSATSSCSLSVTTVSSSQLPQKSHERPTTSYICNRSQILIEPVTTIPSSAQRKAEPPRPIPPRCDVLDLCSSRKTGELWSGEMNDPAVSIRDMPVDVLFASEIPNVGSPSREKNFLQHAYCPSYVVVVGVFLFLLSSHVSPIRNLYNPVSHPGSSLCIAGGGFSGIWYTFGQLHSLTDPLDKDYYCFSAGCFIAVALLSNYTKDDVLDMARTTQSALLGGETKTYDVVSEFLDDLLFMNGLHATKTSQLPTIPMDNPLLLDRLNIITSVKSDFFGLKPSIRKASSMAELKTMLLQTSWIPAAVGGDLWHEGHMDGAFTRFQHPVCAYEAALPFDIDLLANGVNVYITEEKVEKFYRQGLADGVKRR